MELRNRGGPGRPESGAEPNAERKREAPVKRRGLTRFQRLTKVAVPAFVATCLLVAVIFTRMQKAAALFATAAILFFVRVMYLDIPGKPSRPPLVARFAGRHR